MHDTRRTRLVLGVLLAAALALITIDYRGGAASPVRGLRSVGGAVFGTVESAASVVSRPFSAFADGLTGGAGRRPRSPRCSGRSSGCGPSSASSGWTGRRRGSSASCCS